MLSDKLPITALLTVLSFLFTVILSIPLGILAGSVQNKVIDRIVTVIDQIVMSVPPFFVGILSCFLFGITLRLFTPGNFVSYTESWGEMHRLPALSCPLHRLAPYRHDGENAPGRDPERTGSGLCPHVPQPGHGPPEGTVAATSCATP